MGSDISRNDPCPCGSGKKYKQCCINAPTQRADRMSKGAVLVAILSAPIGIAVGYFTDDTQNGVMSGMLMLVIAGALHIFRNPPPSRGRSGADRIGFGM